MKKQVFNCLKSFSTQPIEVDRLIVSAFLEINQLKVKENLLLSEYIIDEKQINEHLNLINFIEIIKTDLVVFNIERLIELFEFVVSPSDRIVNGAIYTPSEIRSYIINQTLNDRYVDLQTIKIADISCGCSGFLYTAAKELKQRTGNTYAYIFQNQIFGLDIQEYSVTRSRLLLTLLALYEGEDIEQFHFNIYHGDALVFKWQEIINDFQGFEIIVGNPPYVSARNLDDIAKENVKLWEVCSIGNPDLYIPFFQIGYENLCPNGILGYITMNTFFKSLNGRALRRYFENNQTSIRIVDFGTHQIFKSKSTYTCICFLEKVEQNFVEYYKSESKELPIDRSLFSRVNFYNLDSKKGWNLKDNEIISRIESIGNPLGKLYKTRHGIATLRNDLFIFKPAAEDDDFFYLQNGDLYPIEKGICKDILNANKLSRNINFNEAKEKVIFPYDRGDKPRALQEEYIINEFPEAYRYFKNKEQELAKRDKGKGKYENWFAFGRTQSLERVGNKLFFPKYSDQTPNFLFSNDIDLLFYNGQAVIGHAEEEMLLLKKIMESRLFWYYIKTTSKPYSSNYYSLNGNYINNFGICDFSNDEVDFIINENDRKILDAFFEERYGLSFKD